MMTTILKVSKSHENHDAMLRALQAAGVGVVEVEDWDEAREKLAGAGCAVLVCDPESVERDTSAFAGAIAAAGGDTSCEPPRDALRALSHDLRTPLSAMSGWLHLLETGKLDEAGTKRAIAKLRGNIEDQVRTLERYVGSRPEGGRR